MHWEEWFRNYKSHKTKVCMGTHQPGKKTKPTKKTQQKNTQIKPFSTHVLKICLSSNPPPPPPASDKHKSALQGFHRRSFWRKCLFIRSFLLLSVSPTPRPCLSQNPEIFHRPFVSHKWPEWDLPLTLRGKKWFVKKWLAPKSGSSCVWSSMAVRTVCASDLRQRKSNIDYQLTDRKNSNFSLLIHSPHFMPRQDRGAIWSFLVPEQSCHFLKADRIDSATPLVCVCLN